MASVGWVRPPPSHATRLQHCALPNPPPTHGKMLHLGKRWVWAIGYGAVLGAIAMTHPTGN